VGIPLQVKEENVTEYTHTVIAGAACRTFEKKNYIN